MKKNAPPPMIAMAKATPAIIRKISYGTIINNG